MVGYSRLTGEDEDATHRTLSAYLDLIATTVESHRGQVLHYAGDAVLARFEALVDALSCAVVIQKDLKTRNTELADNRKLQFRIGVNLGDVIEDRGDIYGDGVNVAARLEGLAEPGGICISGTAYDAIGCRLAVDYASMGEQQVKNIEKPVRAYRVLLEPGAPTKVPSAQAADLELPDEPSVAVLPFKNMSADPEQEYFSDGITEDIITELSRFPALFVIARNSSFQYRGKDISVHKVGAELGVRYVVEGSVRKAGNRIRVTVQLIDVTNESHVWAERYDRDIQDIFALQDDVTQRIVATIAGRVGHAAVELAEHKPPSNLAAYDYVLRGNKHLFHITRKPVSLARELYEKAIEADPDYARAYAGLALSHCIDYYAMSSPSPETSLQLAFESAQRAYMLDDSDNVTHWILGEMYLFRKQFQQATTHLERALALNPNDADVISITGFLLTCLGNPKEGIERVKDAMRRKPFYPDWCSWMLGLSYYVARQYDQAIETLTSIHVLGEGAHRWLAASYAQSGMDDQAREETADLLKLKPDFSTRESVRRLPFSSESDLTHYAEGLRKAGLPE